MLAPGYVAKRRSVDRRKAALKGWATRRAKAKEERPLERARDSALGYLRPAPKSAIPKGDEEADIVSFNVAIFRPRGVKGFDSYGVLTDVMERLNAVIPGKVEISRSYTDPNTGKRRLIQHGNEWQAKIKLPRKTSTATLSRLLAETNTDLTLRRGRIHMAVISDQGEYLPIVGPAFGVFNDAVVYGVAELENDVTRYRSRMSERAA